MHEVESQDPSVAGDAELLGRFIHDHNSFAFGELVRRHGPMVLAVCRRALGNGADAEDAFQATFLVLTMQAASIRNRQNLTAWLWGVARQTALSMKSADLRRRARERRFAEGAPMHSEINNDDPERNAILEAEVDRLAPKHRTPVVMCYLEGRSNREAARLLGLPDGTLATRLREARELLRRRLARRGIDTSADSIGAGLSQSLAPALVPAALANSVEQAVSSSALASHQAVIVAKKVAALMAYSKAKAVAVGALIVLLLGGGTTALVYYAVRPDPIAASAPASASAPAQGQPPAGPQFSWQTPPGLRSGRRAAYNGPAIVGYARSAEGKPLLGARVLLSSVQNPMRLFVDSGTAVSANPAASITSTTTADGRFQLTPNDEPESIVVISPQGIGYASAATLSTSQTIIVQPWGRIDGTARIGARPAARTTISISDWDGDSSLDLGTRRPIYTDLDGHFAIGHVPAGRIDIGFSPQGSAPEHWYTCDVKSGATTTALLGGSGRAVTGHIVPVIACNVRHLNLTMLPPEPFASADGATLTPEQREKLSAQAEKSPQYQQWLRDYSSSPYWATPQADGTFRLEDVPAGNYELQVEYAISQPHNDFRDAVGSVQKTVHITSADGSTLDLGQIPLTLAARLDVGQVIPEISGADANGKLVALSAYRGRYLLFAITTGESDHLTNEILNTRALYDRFGRDSQFAMLTIRRAPNRATTQIASAPAAMPWTELTLKADEAHPLPAVYDATPRPMFLIDPQGRLIAKNLDAQRAYYLVDQLLSHGSESMRGIRIQTDFVPTANASAGAAYGAVPGPSSDVASVNAEFSVVDGLRRPGPNALDCLHDGLMPRDDNDAKQNFYLQGGTFEGRLKIDLGKVIPVSQVNSYSWHRGPRAPQVYVMYASDGTSNQFDPSPKIGTDPAMHGWTRLCNIDTRPASGRPGGRYAVSIAAQKGSLGNYRYFLFELFPTETVDAFGHTFYGEINVVAGTRN